MLAGSTSVWYTTQQFGTQYSSLECNTAVGGATQQLEAQHSSLEYNTTALSSYLVSWCFEPSSLPGAALSTAQRLGAQPSNWV